MKDMGIVRGSAEQAVPLVVGKDTVYVHTDIQKLPPDDERGGEVWEYHEVQYDKDEYIQIIAERNDSLEKQVTDVQLALCDLYEGMV